MKVSRDRTTEMFGCLDRVMEQVSGKVMSRFIDDPVRSTHL
jgi:hypothetical protein